MYHQGYACLYSRLAQKGFDHWMVNHSIQFITDEGVHTNTIESHWRVLKKTVLPKNGTTIPLYHSYFDTYCISKRYLQKEQGDTFKNFLALIKRIYPVKACTSTPRKELAVPKSCTCGFGAARKITLVAPVPPVISDISSSSSDEEEPPAKQRK
jgi:hypothetical protein